MHTLTQADTHPLTCTRSPIHANTKAKPKSSRKGARQELIDTALQLHNCNRIGCFSKQEPWAFPSRHCTGPRNAWHARHTDWDKTVVCQPFPDHLLARLQIMCDVHSSNNNIRRPIERPTASHMYPRMKTMASRRPAMELQCKNNNPAKSPIPSHYF